MSSIHKPYIAAIAALAAIALATVGLVRHLHGSKKAIRQIVVDMHQFKVGTTIGVYADGSVVDMATVKQPKAGLLALILADGRYDQWVVPVPTERAKPNPTTSTGGDGEAIDISKTVHTEPLTEEPC